MVKIIICYHDLLVQLEISPLTKTSILFKALKNSFRLEGDQTNYFLWASKFYEFGDTKLQELGNLHEARLFLVDKSDKEKLEPFMNNILPSIVCEAASLNSYQKSIVSNIHSLNRIMINHSQPGVTDKIIGFISSRTTKSTDSDEIVKELLEWFISKNNFQLIQNIMCTDCQTLTTYKDKINPNSKEAQSSARKTLIYECPQCHKIIRIPLYKDVCNLINVKRGDNEDFANVFSAILKLLGYDVRLVTNLHEIWVEYWSDEKDQYIPVDPYKSAKNNKNNPNDVKPEDLIFGQLVYSNLNLETNWVIAVNECQCFDVTQKYTQDINGCMRRRSTLCPEEWFQKYISFKNKQFLCFFKNDPEHQEQIRNRQEKDIKNSNPNAINQ